MVDRYGVAVESVFSFDPSEAILTRSMEIIFTPTDTSKYKVSSYTLIDATNLIKISSVGSSIAPSVALYIKNETDEQLSHQVVQPILGILPFQVGK